MSGITRQLTVSELSQRILEMARTGVYRESVFEAFQPVATKRQISHAIRHAKQFGLHSIATMRDADLGTYYQLDAVKFASLEPAFKASVPLTEADVLQRVTEATLTIRLMLTIAGGGAIALFSIGLLCVTIGNTSIGWGLVSSSVGAIGIWALQKALVSNQSSNVRSLNTQTLNMQSVSDKPSTNKFR